jgi:hypothetical protein
MTDRALEYSHRITRITWRTTRGMLGARLQASAMNGVPMRANLTRHSAAQFTWRFTPQRFPAIAIEAFADASANAGESFGMFPTERKAYLALLFDRLDAGLQRLEGRRIVGITGLVVQGLDDRMIGRLLLRRQERAQSAARALAQGGPAHAD